jgi:hypothetical protein
MRSSTEATDIVYSFNVKVFGRGANTFKSHSYCVDDTPSGTSSSIGSIQLNILKQKLRDLRPAIEYRSDRHLDKRSLVFQEALFIMTKLPNLFSRPKEELTKYIFGLQHQKSKVVTVIFPEEEAYLITSFVDVVDLHLYDLLLLPLSQLDPHENEKVIYPSESELKESDSDVMSGEYKEPFALESSNTENINDS